MGLVKLSWAWWGECQAQLCSGNYLFRQYISLDSETQASEWHVSYRHAYSSTPAGTRHRMICIGERILHFPQNSLSAGEGSTYGGRDRVIVRNIQKHRDAECGYGKRHHQQPKQSELLLPHFRLYLVLTRFRIQDL